MGRAVAAVAVVAIVVCLLAVWALGRAAVGQHHRGTLPLHAPFRAARVETFAGAGLLARG